MIDLSIIVLSWEARALALACLASVEQALAADRGGLRSEVWLVDNGSRDSTAAAVRERFPQVEVIELAENGGFARGMNAGLARARGRCVVLLNNDARPLAGTFDRCVSYLDAHPDVGIVGPQLVAPDGSLQNSVHGEPRLRDEVLPRALAGWLRPSGWPSRRRPATAPIDVPAVLGACLVARREVLERVGPLPEAYFFFLEETEWCLRTREAGLRVVHLPDARVLHELGASSKKERPAATRIEYHRSLYRFFRRRRGWGAYAFVRTIRSIKSLGYVLLPSPRVLWSRAAGARWASRRAVAAWHLRGCPGTGGLAESAGSSHRAGRGVSGGDTTRQTQPAEGKLRG